MKINRQTLLEDLAEFVLKDHGVIIGKPGVGKSYTLRELKNTLLDKGILAFFVPVDNLIDASDAEITGELGLTGRWVETLQTVSAEAKSILIFDGFDAARDENLRKRVLNQFKLAMEVLSPHWNIIVSVRTYDASKSPDLMRLFPQSRALSSKGARTFNVPVLDASELQAVLTTEPTIEKAYDQATQQLKQILHTPYFLILFKEIVDDLTAKRSDYNEVRGIYSETQLLSEYWERKVNSKTDSVGLERLLILITQTLVRDRKLTIAKTELYETTNATQDANFEYLRSENVLDEYGTLKNRLGYSHNILFDYAVCRISLSDDFAELLGFVKEDLTRPFFLRPSFIYFFTHLWYDSTELFWDTYWKLRDINDKEIKLSVRLIPNSIIGSEYASIDDLRPILDRNDKTERNALLKELFQSIIFLRLDTPEPRDVALIYHLSSDLNFQILWELSLILQRAVENEALRRQMQAVLSESARQFLRFILDKRDDASVANKVGWNRMGSIRGISIVAQTYESDVAESKVLLKRVLDMLKEPGFDIIYISSLIDNLRFITPNDPSFVAEIYLSVFGYVETSDAQTSIGGGVQLNLLSNRRQDYEMCYYALGEYFPKFIESVPKIAIRVGLTIANWGNYAKPWRATGERQFDFRIGTIPCTFRTDLSYFDSEWEDAHDSSTKMITGIIEYFERLVNANKMAELSELIDVYFTHAQSGITWRRLISFGNKYPQQLLYVLFPVSVEPILLASSETVHDLAEFISSTAPYLTPEKLLQIENAILSLLDLPEDAPLGNRSLMEKRASRILNKIPKELVTTERGKRFLIETKPVLNEPLVTWHSSEEPFTTEDWLEEEKADVRQPANAHVVEMRKTLEEFNTEWLNGAPPRDSYISVFSAATALFTTVSRTSEELDRKIASFAYTDIAKTCAIICRSLDTVNDSELEIICDIIRHCFQYVSSLDQEEQNASPAGPYSPTPRTEAAEALPVLAVRRKEPFLELCLNAVRDKNSVVRFNCLKDIRLIKQKYPEEFWLLIYYSLQNEPHSFTAAISLDILRYYNNDKDRVEEAMVIAHSRTDLLYDRSSFTEMFVQVILSLSVRENVSALAFFEQNVTRRSVARQLVYKICESIDPGLGPNDYSKNPAINDKLIGLFNHVLAYWGGELIRVVGEKASNQDPQLKTAIEVFDSAIQQIYFPISMRNRRDRMPVSEDNRLAFYLRMKPSLRLILDLAKGTTADGMLIPHTAFYFSQILNAMVEYDAKDVLGMMLEITKYSYVSGYTFDSSSIEQMVSLVEKIFVDHRALLLEKESFDTLIELLEYYIKSGWPKAFELLWKLNEIFR